MQKFLSMPIGGETRLVSATSAKAVQKGDASGANPTTKSTIFYTDGDNIVLTHGAISGDTFVEFLQDNIVKANQEQWRKVTLDVTDDLPSAVSALAVV